MSEEKKLKIEIVPAIIPENIEHLTEEVGKVMGLVDTIQIDILDGEFAPTTTWPYKNTQDGSWEKITKQDVGLPHWENVNFVDKMIRLRGKFDKERLVPLDKKAFDILHKRKFIQHREHPFNFDYDYMYKKIKKYMTDAGIANGTVHGLRRTFGSKLVQSGVDIYIVSKLLGHSSIKVTEQAYIHLLDSNLKDSVSILDGVW